ncbi:hypothetical protein P7K49_024901, partial [Saguinus oedipus]
SLELHSHHPAEVSFVTDASGHIDPDDPDFTECSAHQSTFSLEGPGLMGRARSMPNA